jgi:hypothetical protein
MQGIHERPRGASHVERLPDRYGRLEKCRHWHLCVKAEGKNRQVDTSERLFWIVLDRIRTEAKPNYLEHPKLSAAQDVLLESASLYTHYQLIFPRFT